MSAENTVRFKNLLRKNIYLELNDWRDDFASQFDWAYRTYTKDLSDIDYSEMQDWALELLKSKELTSDIALANRAIEGSFTGRDSEVAVKGFLLATLFSDQNFWHRMVEITRIDAMKSGIEWAKRNPDPEKQHAMINDLIQKGINLSLEIEFDIDGKL